MTKQPRSRILLLLAAGLFLSALPARAQFPWAGARSVGMGGAQVAAVDDGTAAWANPAALGRLEGWGIQVFGSGLAENRNNLVGTLDNLSNLPFEDIASGERLDLLPELIADLDNLVQPDTAVVFSGVGAIAAHYKGFSLSVGTVPYAGIYPVIDLTHIIPGGGPSNGLEFNESGLNLVGLNAREVRLAYGHGFLDSTVLVGGAARVVFARTYFAHCGVFDCENKDVGDLINEAFDQNALSSTKFAFDLGGEVNLGIFRFGVVGTSLNEPSFDVAVVPGAPASVPLPRQVRGGVAVTPLPFMTLAADGDFLKSDTLAPGTQSQQLSIGAEFRIPLFAFRAGGFHDFAAMDAPWGYSFGVGLHLPAVAIDASVLLSPQGGADPTDVDREVLGAGASVRVHF